jgi:hypothetical protein
LSPRLGSTGAICRRFPPRCTTGSPGFAGGRSIWVYQRARDIAAGPICCSQSSTTTANTNRFCTLRLRHVRSRSASGESGAFQHRDHLEIPLGGIRHATGSRTTAVAPSHLLRRMTLRFSALRAGACFNKKSETVAEEGALQRPLSAVSPGVSPPPFYQPTRCGGNPLGTNAAKQSNALALAARGWSGGLRCTSASQPAHAIDAKEPLHCARSR